MPHERGSQVPGVYLLPIPEMNVQIQLLPFVCFFQAFVKHKHEEPSYFGEELSLDECGRTKSRDVGSLVFSTAECFDYVWVREHTWKNLPMSLLLW